MTNTEFTDEWLTSAGFEYCDESCSWTQFIPKYDGKMYPLFLSDEDGIWRLGNVAELKGVTTRNDLLFLMGMLEMPAPEAAK